MVAYCCICKVEQRSFQDSDTTFHRFPKNESLRLKWCEAIKKNVYNTYVCSKHFKPEDYKNYEDPNLIKKILKPSAVPSIMLSKELEFIENASSRNLPTSADISTKNSSNKSKHFGSEDYKNHENPNLIKKRLKPSTISNTIVSKELEFTENESSMLPSIDISTENSSNKRKTEDCSSLQPVKKQRYQNAILGTVRKTDFINESAWLRFQKYVTGLKKQHKLSLNKSRRLYLKLNKFKNLLKKLRRNNLLSFKVYRYLDKRLYNCYTDEMKQEYLKAL
ncbi:uncharacterized protein LOC105199262 isoform X2 [Solenopsis invicta]|uniref:uncharacterized protein LOC105199262 isoform X2 n=1 Tax=Solenopsis invicta TaxID=13686 RepID=UPI000E33D861|nr:uncharacterized protein LOC105199262 isoform X2 [Solenopsis invicta]